MACNIILNETNILRVTQFHSGTKYNIEDINFYIPANKSREHQVFLVLKNNKNLYEIIELMPRKEGSSSLNILYKVPLKQALRINNESVVLSFLLINNDTGDFIYSSSIDIQIETDNFRIAQQIFVAQQVNYQTQNLYRQMTEMVKDLKESQEKGKEKGYNENGI